MSLSVVGHPSDCQHCTHWTDIPAAHTDFSLNGLIFICQEVYNQFLCVGLVWQWTIIYLVMLLTSQQFFEQFYYPNMLKNYGNYGNNDSDFSLPKNLKISQRSMTAASKAISFIAATTCCIRCFIFLQKEYMSRENLWVSMYISTPKEIVDLLDSLLGYFVVDTIYLLLFRRRWMYIIHHQVAFVCTIALKSFGYGAHIAIPIYLAADSTTIALNIIWFSEDRVKYLQFFADKIHDKKSEIYLKIQFWGTTMKLLQLGFALSFIYMRIYHLSIIALPWAYNLLIAHHANYCHKFICISQAIALLGTGYVWSWHIIKILYKAISGLLIGNKGKKIHSQ